MFRPTHLMLIQPEPTDTAPGSFERMEVYRVRLAAGQPLFVAGDELLADDECFVDRRPPTHSSVNRKWES